jgi:hypothetical protein
VTRQLNVWDIGGQRKIRPYWRNYYDKTDVLVSPEAPLWRREGAGEKGKRGKALGTRRGKHPLSSAGHG